MENPLSLKVGSIVTVPDVSDFTVTDIYTYNGFAEYWLSDDIKILFNAIQSQRGSIPGKNPLLLTLLDTVPSEATSFEELLGDRYFTVNSENGEKTYELLYAFSGSTFRINPETRRALVPIAIASWYYQDADDPLGYLVIDKTDCFRLWLAREEPGLVFYP